MLSLLMCPFLYQETLHAGIIRKFLFASVAVAAGMEIYIAGEYNRTLSPEKQTRLAREGHPYLDATLEIAESTAHTISPFLASASKKLENASASLAFHREEVVPVLIKKYNPFGKSTAIQELENILRPSGTPKENEASAPSEAVPPAANTDELQK